MRLQGQIQILKVIAAMPAQVQADLKRFEEEDRRREHDREEEAAWKNRPGVFSVKGA